MCAVEQGNSIGINKDTLMLAMVAKVSRDKALLSLRHL